MDIGDQTRDNQSTENRQNEDDIKTKTVTSEMSVTRNESSPNIEELDNQRQNMIMEGIQAITICLCWERVGAIAKREQTAATDWMNSSRARTDVQSTLRHLTPLASSHSFVDLAYGVLWMTQLYFNKSGPWEEPRDEKRLRWLKLKKDLEVQEQKWQRELQTQGSKDDETRLREAWKQLQVAAQQIVTLVKRVQNACTIQYWQTLQSQMSQNISQAVLCLGQVNRCLIQTTQLYCPIIAETLRFVEAAIEKQDSVASWENDSRTWEKQILHSKDEELQERINAARDDQSEWVSTHNIDTEYDKEEEIIQALSDEMDPSQVSKKLTTVKAKALRQLLKDKAELLESVEKARENLDEGETAKVIFNLNTDGNILHVSRQADLRQFLMDVTKFRVDIIMLQETKLKQVDADTFETNMQAMLMKETGEPWCVHTACTEAKRSHSGVAFAHKASMKYEIYKGISPVGRPTKEHQDPQGRLIIAKSLEDREDFVSVYAPNGGSGGTWNSHQEEVGRSVRQLDEYWMQNYPRRRLNIQGDLNFSCAGERCHKTTVRDQMTETWDEKSAKACKDAVKKAEDIIAQAPPTGIAGLARAESQLGDRLWLHDRVDILKQYRWRQPGPGATLHQHKQFRGRGTAEINLSYCAMTPVRHDTLRVILDYILVRRPNVKHMNPDEARTEAKQGIAVGYLVAGFIPYDSNVPTEHRYGTDHSLVVSMKLVKQETTADASRLLLTHKNTLTHLTDSFSEDIARGWYGPLQSALIQSAACTLKSLKLTKVSMSSIQDNSDQMRKQAWQNLQRYSLERVYDRMAILVRDTDKRIIELPDTQLPSLAAVLNHHLRHLDYTVDIETVADQAGLTVTQIKSKLSELKFVRQYHCIDRTMEGTVKGKRKIEHIGRRRPAVLPLPWGGEENVMMPRKFSKKQILQAVAVWVSQTKPEGDERAGKRQEGPERTCQQKLIDARIQIEGLKENWSKRWEERELEAEVKRVEEARKRIIKTLQQAEESISRIGDKIEKGTIPKQRFEQIADKLRIDENCFDERIMELQKQETILQEQFKQTRAIKEKRATETGWRSSLERERCICQLSKIAKVQHLEGDKSQLIDRVKGSDISTRHIWPVSVSAKVLERSFQHVDLAAEEMIIAQKALTRRARLLEMQGTQLNEAVQEKQVDRIPKRCIYMTAKDKCEAVARRWRGIWSKSTGGLYVTSIRKKQEEGERRIHSFVMRFTLGGGHSSEIDSRMLMRHQASKMREQIAHQLQNWGVTSEIHVTRELWRNREDDSVIPEQITVKIQTLSHCDPEEIARITLKLSESQGFKVLAMDTIQIGIPTFETRLPDIAIEPTTQDEIGIEVENAWIQQICIALKAAHVLIRDKGDTLVQLEQQPPTGTLIPKGGIGKIQPQPCDIALCIRWGEYIALTPEGTLPQQRIQQQMHAGDWSRSIQQINAELHGDVLVTARKMKPLHVKRSNGYRVNMVIWDVDGTQIPQSIAINWTKVHDKMTAQISHARQRWLNENPARQRWQQDPELRKLKTQYFKSGTEVAAPIHDTDHDRMNDELRDFYRSIRVKPGFEGQMESIAQLDWTRQGEELVSAPMTIDLWVGNPTDATERTLVRALFDSGCSLIAFNSDFADHMKKDYKVKSRPSSWDPPQARDAFKGRKQSGQLIDVGVTMTNAEFSLLQMEEGDEREAPTQHIDMCLSGWTFDGLAYDIILGLPFWEHFHECFIWRDHQCQRIGRPLFSQAVFKHEGDICHVMMKHHKQMLRQEHTEVVAAATGTVEIDVDDGVHHDTEQVRSGVCTIEAILPNEMWNDEHRTVELQPTTGVAAGEVGKIMATNHTAFIMVTNRTWVDMYRTETGQVAVKVPIQWKVETTGEAEIEESILRDYTNGKIRLTIPGHPVATVRVIEHTERVCKTEYRNPHLDQQDNMLLRQQAISIALPFRSRKALHDIAQQRDRIEQIVPPIVEKRVRLLQHEGDILINTQRQAEAEHLARVEITRLLTWTVALVSALPHLTRNILGHSVWIPIVRKVLEARISQWKAAQHALAQLFVLLQAAQAGLRNNEFDDCLDITNEAEAPLARDGTWNNTHSQFMDNLGLEIESAPSSLYLSNVLSDGFSLHNGREGEKDQCKMTAEEIAIARRCTLKNWKRMATLGHSLIITGQENIKEAALERISLLEEGNKGESVWCKIEEMREQISAIDWKEPDDKWEEDRNIQLQIEQQDEEIDQKTKIREAVKSELKGMTYQPESNESVANLQEEEIDKSTGSKNTEQEVSQLIAYLQEEVQPEDKQKLDLWNKLEICAAMIGGNYNNEHQPTKEAFDKQWRKLETEEQSEKVDKTEEKIAQDKREAQMAKIRIAEEQQTQEEEKDKRMNVGSEAGRGSQNQYLHKYVNKPEEDPEIHDVQGKPPQTAATFGAPDEEGLPANIEDGTGLAWWVPDESQGDDPELIKSWKALSERARRYFKSIDVLERGSTIVQEEGWPEGEVERQERALAHNILRHLLMGFEAEWDVSPWNPPCVKTHVFGPEYLTLISNHPIWIPPRPIPPQFVEQALKQTEEMIQGGLVIPNVSAFNMPAICVPKPLARNEVRPKLRIVQDMRAINAQTMKLSYPLMPTHEALEMAQGFELYGCSDCAAGFHQLKICPSIQHMLSYSVGNLKIQPLRMNMGGVNSMCCFLFALNRAIGTMREGCCELTARNRFMREIQEHLPTEERWPNTVEERAGWDKDQFTHTPEQADYIRQRLSENDKKELDRYIRKSQEDMSFKDGDLLQELPESTKGIPLWDDRFRDMGTNYVDDLLHGAHKSYTGSQFAKIITVMVGIAELLRQMDHHGVRLKSSKTSLFRRKLQFLSWEVSDQGLKPSDKKLSGIRNMCPDNILTTPQAVKSVCGGIQYFGRTCPNMSALEAPLYNLVRKGVEWNWTEEHTESLKRLKSLMASDAILTPWDPNGGRAIIMADTSNIACGAILAQEDPITGEERPCAYQSTMLSKEQRKYSASEREMLGILFALDRFRHIVHQGTVKRGFEGARRTKIVTDHAALKETIQNRSLNPRLNKWALFIMGMDLDVEVRAGVKLALPDMLSRCTGQEAMEVFQDGEGRKASQWCTKAFVANDDERPDVGKQVRIHYLQGPKEICKKPLIQHKRRLFRTFMIQSAKNLQKQLDETATREQQTIVKRLNIILEGLKAGERSELDTKGEEVKVPASALDMAEEDAIIKLGGINEIFKMGMDMSLEQSETRFNEVAKEHGQDWTRRLSRGPDGQFWIFKPEDLKTTHELAQEAMPGEHVPEPVKDNSFILAMEQENGNQNEQIEIQPMFGDQFCGIGGIAGGFIEAGFTCGTTCERGFTQRKSLRGRYGGQVNPVRDFEAISHQHYLGHFVVASAAPCTPFSPAGSQQSHQDERSSYFIEQIKELMIAKVPLIILENVPEVTKKTLDKDGTLISPLEKLADVIRKDGHYVEEHRVLNALDAGAAVSRDRMFIQIQLKSLQKHILRKDNIAKIRQKILQLNHHEHSTHEISDQGFVWPTQRLARTYTRNVEEGPELQEMQKIRHYMRPWEEVPDAYKMEKEAISEFVPGIYLRNGVIHLARKQQMTSVGDPHDPNDIIAADGAAASITALGNCRWIASIVEENGKLVVKVRNLTPVEALEIMGFIGQHSVSEEDILSLVQRKISDHVGFQWAGNCVPIKMSKSLAIGMRAVYDPQWMAQHVQEQEHLFIQASQLIEQFRAAISKQEEHRHRALRKARRIKTAVENSVSPVEHYKAFLSYVQGCHLKGQILDKECHVMCLEKALAKAQQYMDIATESISAMQDYSDLDQAQMYRANIIRTRQSRRQLSDSEYDSDSNSDICRLDGGEEEITKIEGNGETVMMVTSEETTEVTPEEDPNNYHTVLTKSGDGKLGKREVMEIGPNKTKGDVEMVVIQARDGSIAKKLNTLKKSQGEEEVDETWREMRQAQYMDDEYRIIAEYCEKGKYPERVTDRGYLETKEQYVVHKGLLYKIQPLSHGRGDVLALCIPRQYQCELATRYHFEMGHPSPNTMVQALRQRYYWRTMIADCARVVKFCSGCQRFKDTKLRLGKQGETQYTQDVGIPGKVLLIDALGPYGGHSKEGARNKNQAIVIQDEFTRYIQIMPQEKIDSEAVVDSLEKWMHMLGCPSHIKTDCASTNVSEGIRYFCSKMRIKKSESAPLRPQSHGKIERVMQHIHAHIRTTLAGRTEGWDRIAAHAATAWNILPHESLGGYCPFYLMFGRMPVNHIDNDFPTDEDECSRPEWVKTRIQAHLIRHKAYEKGLHAYKLNILHAARKRHKERPGEQFKPGDKVKVLMNIAPARGGLATKLQARWAGNYEIVDRVKGTIGDQTWYVKRSYDDTPSVAIHVSRLKRYYDKYDKSDLTDITFIRNIRDDYASAIVFNENHKVENLSKEEECDVREMRRTLASPVDEDIARMKTGEMDVILCPHEQRQEVAKTKETSNGTRAAEMRKSLGVESKDDMERLEPFHTEDLIREAELRQEESNDTGVNVAQRSEDENTRVSRRVKKPPTRFDVIKDGRNDTQLKQDRPLGQQDEPHSDIQPNVSKEDDEEVDIEPEEEMDNGTEQLHGYENTKERTFHQIATTLQCPTSTLLKYNKQYFHKVIKGHTKVPVHWIVRIDPEEVGIQQQTSIKLYPRKQIGDQRRFRVKRIVGRRENAIKGLEFQVEWDPRDLLEGESKTSWEPSENLTCPGLVKKYEDDQLRKHSQGFEPITCLNTDEAFGENTTRVHETADEGEVEQRECNKQDEQIDILGDTHHYMSRNYGYSSSASPWKGRGFAFHKYMRPEGPKRVKNRSNGKIIAAAEQLLLDLTGLQDGNKAGKSLLTPWLESRQPDIWSTPAKSSTNTLDKSRDDRRKMRAFLAFRDNIKQSKMWQYLFNTAKGRIHVAVGLLDLREIQSCLNKNMLKYLRWIIWRQPSLWGLILGQVHSIPKELWTLIQHLPQQCWFVSIDGWGMDRKSVKKRLAEINLWDSNRKLYDNTVTKDNTTGTKLVGVPVKTACLLHSVQLLPYITASSDTAAQLCEQSQTTNVYLWAEKVRHLYSLPHPTITGYDNRTRITNSDKASLDYFQSCVQQICTLMCIYGQLADKGKGQEGQLLTEMSRYLDEIPFVGSQSIKENPDTWINTEIESLQYRGNIRHQYSTNDSCGDPPEVLAARAALIWANINNLQTAECKAQMLEQTDDRGTTVGKSSPRYYCKDTTRSKIDDPDFRIPTTSTLVIFDRSPDGKTRGNTYIYCDNDGNLPKVPTSAEHRLRLEAKLEKERRCQQQRKRKDIGQYHHLKGVWTNRFEHQIKTLLQYPWKHAFKPEHEYASLGDFIVARTSSVPGGIFTINKQGYECRILKDRASEEWLNSLQLVRVTIEKLSQALRERNPEAVKRIEEIIEATEERTIQTENPRVRITETEGVLQVRAKEDIPANRTVIKDNSMGLQLEYTSNGDEANCEIICHEHGTQVRTTCFVKRGTLLKQKITPQGGAVSVYGKKDEASEKESVDQVVERIRFMTIEGEETAEEFFRGYYQAYGGRIVKAVTEVWDDPSLYVRFHKALTFLEGKQSRKDKAQNRPLKAEFEWLVNFDQNRKVYITIPRKEVESSEECPDMECEVDIMFKDKDQDYQVGGTVISVTRNDDLSRTLDVKVSNKLLEVPDTKQGKVRITHRDSQTLKTIQSINKVHGKDSHENCKKIMQQIMGGDRDKVANAVVTAASKHAHEWQVSFNKEQREAMLMVIGQQETNELGRIVSLIQGPPGTGKSYVITFLVAMYVYAAKQEQTREKVLLATPTNRTAEDLTGHLVKRKDPKGQTIGVIWAVAKGYIGQIMNKQAGQHTLRRASIYPQLKDDAPLNDTQQKRLQQLDQQYHKKGLNEENMMYYRTLLRLAATNCVEKAGVIVATIAQTGTNAIQKQSYSMALIEEAGLVPETSVHMVIATEPRQLVIVGDEKQMSARQVVGIAEKIGVQPVFHRFEQLDNLQKVQMREQRRSPQACIEASSQTFYDGKLRTNPEIEQQRYADNMASGIWKDAKKPQAWINVEHKEAKCQQTKSSKNEGEAQTCVDIAARVVAESNGQFKADDIGILTMYKAQVTAIRQLVQAHPVLKAVAVNSLEEMPHQGTSIDTVDRYQGMERKIIILSIVRSKDTPSLFIRDKGRVNVAFTRCTHGNIVVGNRDVAARFGANQDDHMWQNMVRVFQENAGGLKFQDSANDTGDEPETDEQIDLITEESKQEQMAKPDEVINLVPSQPSPISQSSINHSSPGGVVMIPIPMALRTLVMPIKRHQLLPMQ